MLIACSVDHNSGESAGSAMAGQRGGRDLIQGSALTGPPGVQEIRCEVRTGLAATGHAAIPLAAYRRPGFLRIRLAARDCPAGSPAIRAGR